MGYRVAVVGATGNVGREILNILSERQFPLAEVAAVASPRSTGDIIDFGENGEELKVKNREMGRKQKITAELIARYMRKIDASEKVQQQIWRDRESRPTDPAVQELVSQVLAPPHPQHLDVYEDF